jgi:mannose-6-phosphate isomerase-like protein (cupin superfamily)
VPDVTAIAIDDMEPIFDGLARRARASLGVTGWGMQVFSLPPTWDGYPLHAHAAAPRQEEVYIPLSGGATLEAGEERIDLRPGMMVRVGPEQPRRILPGETGIRLIAIGNTPGAYDPQPWTELGGPLPVAA